MVWIIHVLLEYGTCAIYYYNFAGISVLLLYDVADILLDCIHLQPLCTKY